MLLYFLKRKKKQISMSDLIKGLTIRVGDHCFRGLRSYTNNTEKALTNLNDRGSKIIMPF